MPTTTSLQVIQCLLDYLEHYSIFFLIKTSWKLLHLSFFIFRDQWRGKEQQVSLLDFFSILTWISIQQICQNKQVLALAIY